MLDLFAENAYLVVRNLQIIESMIGKKSSEHQMSIFEVALESFIDMTKFCKRAGIEPVSGHLKSDHRMMRNYLKGTLGDAINTLMAAAAYNMRHWMNKNALSSFVSWLLALDGRLENVILGNENKSVCLCPTLVTVA